MTHTGNEIAIIGMAGRFPGAPDLATFWRNLRDGVESISTFADAELESSPLMPDHMRQLPHFVPAGGVLRGAEEFDHGFFGISLREARWMDPQQRVMLEVAWSALADAGYDPARFGQRICVYAGAAASTHSLTLLGSLTHDPASIYEALGTASAENLASKLAFTLGLRGEAVTVHTACSTGLSAVHLACQSLLLGQSAMAIAGASRIITPQRTGYLYQDGMVLSRDGHCRAFDHRASGTVSGNGAGVVVLRPLADALADNDHIYAVIKGSAINNDGHRGVGYTAPSVAGQADVITEALAFADVSPKDIGYVEAHGTGTPLGDPIEIAGLTRAYRHGTDRVGDCLIGSVKTNIGHLDTAAGIAGLIKVALILHHGEIPPSLHLEQANPAIDFAGSPFLVNSDLRAWRRTATPRLAGVSSFGIGGTNVHAIVAEAPPPAESSPSSRPRHLITLSARTPSALATIARNLADAAECGELAEVAYTLAVGRAALPYRRTHVVSDPAELVATLRRPSRADPPATQQPRVALLFPGQGAATYGMAADLSNVESYFRDELDRCLAELEPRLGRPLRPALMTGSGVIDDAELAHAALFAVEYALARLWLGWGVRPVALLGHSFGEYAAACVAGLLSLSDAANLTVARGRLVARMPAGAMLAVALDEHQLARYLTGGLSLAAVNGDDRCVVSGPADEVGALRQRLAGDGHASVALPVRYAFHSAAVEPMLSELAAAAAGCHLGQTKLPLVSSLTGDWWTADDGGPGYWARQMREPVRFADALRTLAADGPLVLVEAGPDQALTALARAQLGQRARVVPSLRRAGSVGSDHRVLLDSVGALWRAGVPIDWAAFYRFERRRRVPLPGYPFEGVDCGLDAATPAPVRAVPTGSDVPDVPTCSDSTDLAKAAGSPTAVAVAAPEFVEADDGPRDEIESRVLSIWQDRLGTTDFGIHDNFLELGGNSLMAAQMLTRLRETFSVPLPLSALFDAPTVAGIADRIRSMTVDPPRAEVDGLPPIRPVPRGDTVPLSIVQQRTLALTAIDPDNPALLMPVAVRMDGLLDVEELRQAVCQVVTRHEALRTTFHRTGGEWTARLEPEASVDFDVEVMSELDAAVAAQAEAATEIDLSAAPLRVRLLRLAANRHVLLLTLHHVVSDTWSMVTFLGELAAFYQGAPLPPLPVQYADFADWQQRLSQGNALDQQRAYWRTQDAPPLPLPTDRPRRGEQGFRGVRIPVVLSTELATAVHEFSQRFGVTPFITLLAGYTALLSRVSGADQVVVGTPIGNRDRAELEPLIGFVAHAVPLRTDVADDPSFDALIRRVKQTLLSAYAHPDLPFEHCAPAPTPGGPCRLFDAVFVLHAGIAPEQELPSLTWRLWDVPDLPAQFGASLSALSLMLGETPTGFTGTLEFAAELFDAASAHRVVAQFHTLLADAVSRPEARLSELAVSSAVDPPHRQEPQPTDRLSQWLALPQHTIAVGGSPWAN